MPKLFGIFFQSSARKYYVSKFNELVSDSYYIYDILLYLFKLEAMVHEIYYLYIYIRYK